MWGVDSGCEEQAGCLRVEGAVKKQEERKKAPRDMEGGLGDIYIYILIERDKKKKRVNPVRVCVCARICGNGGCSVCCSGGECVYVVATVV